MTDWTKCKLVPVEATPEMRDVFTAAEGSATHYTHTTIRCGDFDSRYAAMLAAAPPAPVVEVTDEVAESAMAIIHALVHPEGHTHTRASLAREWLRAWQQVLPQLGMVTREELARERELLDAVNDRLRKRLRIAMEEGPWIWSGEIDVV